ncbi:putative pumilio homolog 8 chloroplastic [Phtheirospermum japonicum]|uniref:Putative pumilio homolog 8 chloroplastic n=1 Tax=Phtheirospermum japonicum TaxID=374723 RepID=A0A830C3C4_9LAMI|nr:putative pumilio homolog 8 chloroplastic [Phtheirospermum japonicum]
MCSGALDLEVGLSEQEIEMVFPQVVECLCDLMRNQFGSNFVHKFFVACNEDQRTRIIMALTKSPYKLITICLNSYGVRAVQKLLEKLSTPQQISLVVSALSPGAITLANDPSGHHVIQYCVRSFPVEYNKTLFNEIADNCFKIATNKSGCCVVPPCVEYSHGEARKRLIREIIANAVHLAEDPYGNYVVQHLLGLGMQEVRTDLLRRLQGSFVSLSCNKYASNVVEKLLFESGENHAAVIIMELLTSPNASMLLLDPFGNFVIQSALSVSKVRHSVSLIGQAFVRIMLFVAIGKYRKICHLLRVFLRTINFQSSTTFDYNLLK